MIFHYDSKVISIPGALILSASNPFNFVICGWGRRIVRKISHLVVVHQHYSRDLFVPDGTRIGPLKVDEMVVGAVLNAFSAPAALHRRWRVSMQLLCIQACCTDADY